MPAPSINQERRKTMPRFDGTGPYGMGPMTGGGRGYCMVPSRAPETELDSLKSQAHALKTQLGQIEATIENMRGTKSKSTVRSK
jgi:hypothetical protein